TPANQLSIMPHSVLRCRASGLGCGPGAGAEAGRHAVRDLARRDGVRATPVGCHVITEWHGHDWGGCPRAGDRALAARARRPRKTDCDPAPRTSTYAPTSANTRLRQLVPAVATGGYTNDVKGTCLARCDLNTSCQP